MRVVTEDAQGEQLRGENINRQGLTFEQAKQAYDQMIKELNAWQMKGISNGSLDARGRLVIARKNRGSKGASAQ